MKRGVADEEGAVATREPYPPSTQSSAGIEAELRGFVLGVACVALGVRKERLHVSVSLSDIELRLSILLDGADPSEAQVGALCAALLQGAGWLVTDPVPPATEPGREGVEGGQGQRNPVEPSSVPPGVTSSPGGMR